MISLRTLTSKFLVLLFSGLTTVLAVTTIVYSFMQSFDMPIENFNEGFCASSILNEYRPFRVFYEPDPVNGTVTTYKMCSLFENENHLANSMSPLSSHNGTVRCAFLQPYSSGLSELYCGWDKFHTIRRVGICLVQCLFIFLAFVWIIKDWKILGLVYTLLVLLGLVANWWIMITDADSTRKSREFCQGFYYESLCNPPQFPEYPNKGCDCNYWNFVTLILLDAGAIILWSLLLVVCVVRFIVSCFYSDPQEESFSDDFDGEKKRLRDSASFTSSLDSNRNYGDGAGEDRVKEIIKSYQQ